MQAWLVVAVMFTGFAQVLEILEKFWNFENLIPGPGKVWNLEFGFGKVLDFLKIHCQTACTVQYTYDLVGWPWEFLGLFCPVRSVLGWEWVLEKVLEKFWNLALQNLCEPCQFMRKLCASGDIVDTEWSLTCCVCT